MLNVHWTGGRWWTLALFHRQASRCCLWWSWFMVDEPAVPWRFLGCQRLGFRSVVVINHKLSSNFNIFQCIPCFEPNYKTKTNHLTSCDQTWYSTFPTFKSTFCVQLRCQPFTRTGNQRDLADPRCRALLRLLEALPRLKVPPKVRRSLRLFAGKREPNTEPGPENV